MAPMAEGGDILKCLIESKRIVFSINLRLLTGTATRPLTLLRADMWGPA